MKPTLILMLPTRWGPSRPPAATPRPPHQVRESGGPVRRRRPGGTAAGLAPPPATAAAASRLKHLCGKDSVDHAGASVFVMGNGLVAVEREVRLFGWQRR